MMHSNMFMPHHSMLIHISRYTKWQNKLKELIDIYIKDLQSSLELDDPNNAKSIFSVFERVWFRYYANIIEHISDYLPKGYDDEFFQRLDADRPSDCKLFPPEMKGISW